jgi:thioredoxin reductase
VTDAMFGETSIPGIHAAGDLVTAAQAASLAAASGVRVAAALNHGLTVELAIAGALP